MPESPEPNDHPPRSWPADWLNQIHHGDCLDLLAQLPDESVDLVVTSPPYNLRSGGRCRGWPGYDGYGDDLPHDEYVAWQQESLREMYRVIKPTGAIFYNHAPRIQKCVQWRHEDILEPFDVRQAVIWHRAGGVNHNPHYLSPSYEYIYVIAKPDFRVAADWTIGDVWKMGQEKKRWIPEVPAFPVQLPQNAIRATGAKIVLDCFMGSGTTAVAAVLEGADYIGIEQSARYCAVARERVAAIPPGGEPVEPPALYTASRPEPGRAELGGKAGVVYNAIRELIEAAGLHEITRSQVSLAQEIAMPLKTFRRAVEKIRTTRALIVTNRGASTGFALPINVPNASDSAMFVAPIKDGPMDGPMARERGPMDGHMASESGPMAREDGPMDGHMASESGPMAREDGPMDGHMASESGPMARESGPMDGHMASESGPMARESGPMTPESGPMDSPMAVSYRLTGTDSRINEFKESEGDTNRATGSDGPMKIPLVAGQRASPESAWPSESAPDPAGVWRSVLGRLELNMPRDYFNTFLQPCVGYAWEDGDLVVAAASAFVVSWLDLPLHRAMAEEALADTLGQGDASIIWRVLPTVVQANEEGNPTGREPPGEPSPVEPEYCPEHPEPHLRARSHWYTAREVEKENDDEIYYCKGGGSLCTWVYSVKEGCIWEALADKQLQQTDLRKAYHAAQYRRAQQRLMSGRIHESLQEIFNTDHRHRHG